MEDIANTVAENDLKGQEVTNTTFRNCRFFGANLRFSSFVDCQFITCDFSGVIFDGTAFSKCTFPESKLSYLDFAETKLTACDFSHAVLKNCVFQQFKTGSTNERKRCDMSSCRFVQSDLSNSVFFYCNLTEVPFLQANLEHAVFDRCTLKKTNFTGASLWGTSFPDSKIENTVLDLDGFLAFGASQGFTLAQ